MKLTNFVVLLIAVFVSQAWTNEAIDRGLKKSATCVACHGQGGKSVNPLWPNLAGQKKEYLRKQLADFKSKLRNDPLMSPMAQALTEADMDDLAAYYSSIQP